MLVSKNWLKEYVFLPDSLDPKELALKLKLTTVEVEGITVQGEYLENVVVGLVKKVEKHPSADRLQVCQVNIGNEEVQIVCGGSNVAEGMKVALGKIGAKVLWHGEGGPVVLAETKIRGVESFGMICGADEIGLGDAFPKKDEKEILDLSHLDAKAGTPLKQALQLDDVIFEIDNKSMTHRPDLWGHLGLAREIAAIDRKELHLPNPPIVKPGKKGVIAVDVEGETLCHRYMGVVLSGIDVQPSPEHIQKRLRAVGIRPINNIVDITNYVMLDIGQPLHAFDAEKVVGVTEQKGVKNIIVRAAKEGEVLRALDGKEYTLTPEMLVIASEEKALAVAGVIGGEESSVTGDTKTIILESANFAASSVRKTSQTLNVRTESSSRFEKTLDPTLCELALRRAVQLIQDVCPDVEVMSNVIDKKQVTLIPTTITITLQTIINKIGVAIEKKMVIDMLTRLGFSLKEKKDVFFVTVPTWRATKDVLLPEDLIEEIARLYGYEQIPATLPTFPITPPVLDEAHIIERKIRSVLSEGKNFSEVYNYSFVSREWAVQIEGNVDHYLELDNPIAKDRPLLRRTLIHGLLENVESNLHRCDRVALFELGRVYRTEEAGERATPNGDELLPRQPRMLGLVFAQKGVSVPFTVASDALHTLFHTLGIEFSLEKNTSDVSYLHTGRIAHIMVGGQLVGRIAELHPAVQERIGISLRVAFVELDIDRLVAHAVRKPAHYGAVPEYPAIARDIACVVEASVQHADVYTLLRFADPLITDVELFDIYRGTHIEAGKKSMGYRVVYRSDARTLEASEVDKIHAEVTKKLVKKFSATIRE